MVKTPNQKRSSRTSPVVTRSVSARRRSTKNSLNSPSETPIKKEAVKSDDVVSVPKSETKKDIDQVDASTTTMANNEKHSDPLRGRKRLLKSKERKSLRKIARANDEIASQDSASTSHGSTNRRNSSSNSRKTRKIDTIEEQRESTMGEKSGSTQEEHEKMNEKPENIEEKSENMEERESNEENGKTMEEKYEGMFETIKDKQKKKKKKKIVSIDPNEESVAGQNSTSEKIYEEIMESVYLGSTQSQKQIAKELDDVDELNAIGKERMWMRNLEKVLISYEGDKRVKGLLEYCVSRPQVPRKRKKFISFAASTCQEPDVEIAKEVWNILDGSKYNRIICNGINLGNCRQGEEGEGIRKVTFGEEADTSKQPGVMIQNVGHVENTEDLLAAVSGNLKRGKFHLKFYPDRNFAVLESEGGEAVLDSSKLVEEGIEIDGKFCEVNSLGTSKHVKIDVCHEPVRLLVLNAPEDLEVNKMQAFFPGCVKVTRLGMTSFEATFATVKGAMEAMELAADTKIEGRRLLCYFCKRSATTFSGSKKKTGEAEKIGSWRKNSHKKSKKHRGDENKENEFNNL